MSQDPGFTDVQTRLHAARTRLILDKPFIGVLLLHLPFEAAAWCATVATDARRLFFNPEYIARLAPRHLRFVLAHEAMHCALGHFARRQHRVRERWDSACDHAVNLLLLEEGMEPPPGALIDIRYRGLSAEEIYPLLAQGSDQPTLDTHLFDHPGMGGSGTGATKKGEGQGDDGMTESAWIGDDDSWSDAASQGRRNRPNVAPAAEPGPSAQELAQRWQMRVAMAAQQARHAGRLSASWQRLIARTIPPALPWRALLARFVMSRAHDDYSFQRPARREGDALLPRLHSLQMDLYAILDTSGSIDEAQLSEFVAELDALKGQVRARVSVHACDDRLASEGPWVFQPWEPIVLPPRLTGGGATDFAPVFEWIRDQALRPDLLLYFTDAQGSFPASPPPYPVIWLVKGNAPVAWGERIQFS